MTKQDQQIALAEFDGWSKCICGDSECGVWFNPQKESQLSHPDYLNDLNAIRGIELKIACDIDLWARYAIQLIIETNSQMLGLADTNKAMTLADCPARSRAAAKVIDKWKD